MQDGDFLNQGPRRVTNGFHSALVVWSRAIAKKLGNAMLSY